MITIDEEKWIEVMQGVIDTFLKPNFISLGMNASGEWLESLEARAVNNRGEIWGRDYTYYLVNGRAPGKRPPIAPLVSWVGHKFGLQGRHAMSAAFAVANKIAKRGTEYYPSGTDLLSILNSNEVKNYVYNELGVFVAAYAELEIIRNLKKTLSNG